MRLTHAIWSDWNDLPHQSREKIKQWMRDNGIEPDMHRAVTLTGEGQVTVERLVLDADGKSQVHPDRPNELWIEEVAMVVATPPPPEWDTP